VSRKSHPNLIHLKGFVIRDNRIIGIASKRYHTTMQELVLKRNNHPIDKEVCLRGIASGIEYIHSLGLAHNDINPSNIVMDEDSSHPIIIDLGSCRTFSKLLLEGGTPGWNDGFFDTSDRWNDLIGLAKVNQWLQKSSHQRKAYRVRCTSIGPATIDY
jgi:serine/threonine protein kinase